MRNIFIVGVVLVMALLVGWQLPPLAALEEGLGTPRDIVTVERLTGPEAASYLSKRVAESPAVRTAYERSRDEMMARGYQPTETVHVERRLVQKPVTRAAGNVIAQLTNLLVARVSAQTFSESNESGEWIASAWSDGNDDTWEGSLYVQRYSDGAWRLFDSQLDAGTSDDSSNEPIYHSFQGGRGGGGPLSANWTGGRKPRALFVNLIGADSDVVALKNANAAVAAQLGCDWLCKANQWATCTRAWCTSAAIGAYGCRRAGPGWLGCFGIACTGAQVGCALQTWF